MLKLVVSNVTARLYNVNDVSRCSVLGLSFRNTKHADKLHLLEWCGFENNAAFAK
jgi:hypothetical protein